MAYNTSPGSVFRTYDLNPKIWALGLGIHTYAMICARYTCSYIHTYIYTWTDDDAHDNDDDDDDDDDDDEDADDDDDIKIVEFEQNVG
eukprot:4931455-Karenia_brevis.AAC.1